MLCHESVIQDTSTACSIEIDTLHNTLLIGATQCVLCTPLLDGNYQQRLTLLDEAGEDLNLATVTLERAQEHAEKLNWIPSCTRKVQFRETDQQKAEKAVQARNHDVTLAYKRIQDSVQATIELSENVSDRKSPVFYYGPVDVLEQAIHGLDAPVKTGFDAFAYKEHIVDWSEPSNGRKQIHLWRF